MEPGFRSSVRPPGQLVVETAKGVAQVPEADVRTTLPVGDGEAVLAQAKQFLGLPYLWAGTSAYGFDCSGLTYAIYRQFGITLARDAADQAQQGTSVPNTQLRPGDLFFASAGLVHHVAVYAGTGSCWMRPRQAVEWNWFRCGPHTFLLSSREPGGTSADNRRALATQRHS
jgi:gamma-D-glutamyl-L-lysine dipeptidyl-peptidase